MASKSESAGGGIGFFGLLGLLFIGLKLGGCIDWAWWIVLAPLWGPLAFALILVAVLFLFALLAYGAAEVFGGKK